MFYSESPPLEDLHIGLELWISTCTVFASSSSFEHGAQVGGEWLLARLETRLKVCSAHLGGR